MPNWSPEGPQGLSGTLDPNALEETTAKMWAEFLGGYFTGTQHGLIAYPQCVFAFQQRAFPQELNGVGIRIVSNVPGGTRPRRHGRGDFWTLDNPATWTFIVCARVTGNRSDGQNSDSLCRITSDLLYALLLKWDRLKVLNRAGLQKIRVKPPVLAASTEFCARKMQVSGTIHVDLGEEYTSLLIGDGELIVGDNGEVLRVG